MAKRTSYGATWWGQRWIAALERFGWASRLQRGRSYARSGHVKELEIKTGKVTARVAGSRPQPYRIAISVQPLSAEEWNRVIATLAERAVFAASLLSGEMPQEIEDAFVGVKVPLFPATAAELSMSCTCPDWANPCKHVAAAYYRLGEEFDRDPFLLLHLRGRDREALLSALRERRAAGEEPEAVTVTDLDRFWRPNERVLAIPLRMEPPAVPATLLRRLGPLTGLDGADAAMLRLEHYYATISSKALALATGEDEEDGRP